MAGSSDGERFIAFVLSGEQYAIPLLNVKEVIALTGIRPVPDAPAYFKGILDLRGQVISVIDLRTRLHLPPPKGQVESPIIILEMGDVHLGVIVDAVESVIGVDRADIKAPPPADEGWKNELVTGIVSRADRLVLVLDIERALGQADLKRAREATAA